MAGKANAESWSASEAAINTAATPSGGSIVHQIAADFAAGDQQTRQKVSNLISRAADPNADPVFRSTIESVFDAAGPDARSQMLDIAGTHSASHPLFAHSEMVARPEGEAMAAAEEPAPAVASGDKPVTDLRYSLTTYGGNKFRDNVRKRFGSVVGNNLNTLMGKELQMARSVLAKRGLDPAELKALPPDALLGMLTPGEIGQISSMIDADIQASRGEFGQQNLGGRGGETLMSALSAAINAQGSDATINLPRLVPWWRAGFAESTPDGVLIRSPNALNERMLAGLVADSLSQGGDFANTITPAIKNSIRQYASQPPLIDSRGRNRSEFTYAQEALDPSKQGMHVLKRLAAMRDGVPFTEYQRPDRVWGQQQPLDHPMFSDIPLNRGANQPAYLGPDIAVPGDVETPAPAIDQQAPPVEPSSRDVGFFNRRTQPGMPEILSGLLA